jgi:hypothetical protein
LKESPFPKRRGLERVLYYLFIYIKKKDELPEQEKRKKQEGRAGIYTVEGKMSWNEKGKSDAAQDFMIDFHGSQK